MPMQIPYTLASEWRIRARKIKRYWDDRSFFWCTSKNIASSGGGGYMNVIILQLLCIFSSIVHTVANTNLPEAFLYYKIFKKMKRYGTI